MTAADLTPLEDTARKFFLGPVEFMRGVVALDGLPPEEHPEIAFAGRSNVGKSTLVNALTGRKTLARTSNTPGRTQQINYFNLSDTAHLVDLPGYGYARVSKTQVRDWTKLVLAYLKGRPSLRRVMLLIDGRRGLMATDREIMDMLDVAAVSYQVVLTKCDKLKTPEFQAVVAQTLEEVKTHVAAHPKVMLTAALKDKGIKDLRTEIWAAVTGTELPDSPAPGPA